MRNRRISFYFLLTFFATTFSILLFSSENTVKSSWTETPLTIDGLTKDWANETLALENVLNVEYAFLNDGENLYILFIFKDPSKMSSIQQTGMTLWFDITGTRKKEYGLRFQTKMFPTEAYIALLEKQMGPMPEMMKEQLRQKKSHLVFHNQVIDKKGETAIMVTGPNAPAYKSNLGKDMSVYEFRIPLKKVKAQVVGIGTEPGRTVKIGFEWGGLTKEMKEEMMRMRAEKSKVSDLSAEISGELKQERDGVSGGYDLAFQFKKGTKKHSFWVDVALAQK